MTPEQQVGSGVRIKILVIAPCAAGYFGWVIDYKLVPNGPWLLTPAAGDSFSLCGG